MLAVNSVGGFSPVFSSIPPLYQNFLWPNEPGGSTVITDVAFDKSIPVTSGNFPAIPNMPSGWFAGFNDTGGVTSVNHVTQSIVSDLPLDATNCLQAYYPLNFIGGGSPGALFYNLPVTKSKLYVGYTFKYSNPWQWNSNGSQKQMYMLDPGGPHIIFGSTTINGPATVDVGPAGDPRIDAGTGGTATTLVLNTWYRRECLYWLATSGNNGMVWDWLSPWNGISFGRPVLQLSSFTLDTSSMNTIYQVEIYPGWGGGSQKTQQDDYLWYGHCRISSTV